MALTPSCQLHPRNNFFVDSFQSRLQFYRYSSSVQSKKQFRCGVLEHDWSDCRAHWKNQQKRFDLLRKHKKRVFGMSVEVPMSWSTSVRVSLSRSSWLGNWDVTCQNNGGRKPQAVMNYRNMGDVSSSDAEEGTSTSSGGSTMQRIVEKLKKFGYMDDVNHQNDDVGEGIDKGSIEDIFYVEEGLLPNSRGGFSQEFPFGDNSVVSRGNEKVRFPWERSETNEQKSTLDSRKTRSLAEMTLPESEITRLRNLALRTKTKMRITGAGVTQQAVETIHEKWKTSEVVRLKVEGPPALNMKRMHEILERKTGGLVIWRSGTSVSLYRGVTYKNTARKLKQITRKSEFSHEFPSSTAKTGQGSLKFLADADALQSRSISHDPECEPSSPLGYEDEVEKLLDNLGPRYEDWPGDGPLPVDADLLPGVVPDYQPPFRLLPYGVRSTLGPKEATALRRLARGLPPHFALGRSRQHQGLAVAMVKLWERSSIAKVALKRGVQLTTSERMAEDIKKLTGGMLLSANKEYLVYYRGKDFLSPDVAEALLEKETAAKALQDEEEQARLRASALVAPSLGLREEPATAGSLEETLEADTRWGKQLDDDHKEKVMRDAELLRHADLVRKLENKLAFAERKLTKAERALSKVESSLNPADRAEHAETLTDEERFMFRKLGLRMKAFLLLGRRGVFDGTVENMHLHWKYRELVKIIVNAPTIGEVQNIAIALEAESGGILVSVDKLSKGYAIVVFRGRDYKRPPLLRPKNLLTKRKALARSIELQRRQALLTHVSSVEARVQQLRSEIEQMAAAKERGDEELYNKLNSAYTTDEDSEEEEEKEEGNYPEIYEQHGEHG